jgi:hypothetical protein
VAAKGKSTIKTNEIVQNVLIDDFTQLGAECTTRGTTKQAADDAASDGADYGTDRTSDGTSQGTEFSASEDTGSHAYGSCNGANGAAGTPPIVTGVNSSAIAFWTNHDHVKLPFLRIWLRSQVKSSQHDRVTSDFVDVFDDAGC